MRILVTGADGFVGQHLCDELEQGHVVIRSDRADADLAEPYQAQRLVRSSRPDYVVHLAARYGRLLCRDEPHRAVADNTASTTELAAVCAEGGSRCSTRPRARSTATTALETISEDSELRMPTTIYGLSKRWGEEVLRLYLPPEDLTIVRMNMLYGPEQLGGYGRCSLATFIANAVDGQPFTVHRGTSRSWLYITDAVRALRALIEQRHAGVFNLGHTAAPIPMLDVAWLVSKRTGTLFEIEDPPARQIAHKNYNCKKLLRTIDWRPEVGLAEGIDHTIEWAKSREEVAA